MTASFMVDKHGRQMKKLRVSLLDACNQRCIYCMPEDATFSKKEKWLPFEELSEITNNLIELGIKEIRLTGGEPTIRPGYIDFIKSIHSEELENLSLTTNGLTFGSELEQLKEAGLRSINFSLDTLVDFKFKEITKKDGLQTVLNNILKAKALGLKIKINCVIMKGINDNEILDFIQFANQNKIDVRFLETMNIGVVTPHFDRWFLSAADMIKTIEKSFSLTKVNSPTDSTSFNFLTDQGGKIGFIASESKPFCGGCSRLRLDSKGIIRPCLFKDEGLHLSGKSIEQYPAILESVIDLKPMERIKILSQPMYQVGG